MSNGAPFSCDYAYSEYDGMIPSNVNVRNNKTFRLFQKYLLMQIFSQYEFNIPDEWDRDYFYNTLFVSGKLCFLNSRKYGIIPQNCTLCGYNVFYKPSSAMVCNPLLPSVSELKIGKDCEILHINPDYSGVMDIVDYYAEMMALTAETLQTNVQNCKLAYVFCAENKAVAESFKKLYDKIQCGEPAVFADKNLFNAQGNLSVQMFNQSLNGAYIGDKLMDTLQNFEYEFCKKVGIPTEGQEKSQYVSNNAIEKCNSGASALAVEWLNRMKEDIEKINSMFGLSLSVELRKEENAKNDSETMDSEE